MEGACWSVSFLLHPYGRTLKFHAILSGYLSVLEGVIGKLGVVKVAKLPNDIAVGDVINAISACFKVGFNFE